MAANGSGIAAGGYFYNYQRELQLGFVLIMKLRTFAWLCSSSRIYFW
jgi:hypothetical protein